jgi:hypothetical protein
MPTPHENIIAQAPLSAVTDEPAIARVHGVLADYNRRQAFRQNVSIRHAQYQQSPHRFWNAKNDRVIAALARLRDALNACEHEAMRPTNYALYAPCIARHAPIIAAALADANAAIDAIEGRNEPTNPAPPTRTVTVRNWRDVQTEAELRSHLKTRGLDPETAFVETEAPAPASTRAAPSSRVPDAWAKQNRRLWAVMKKNGVSECRESRMRFASMYLGRAVQSFRDLTAEEVGRIADAVGRGEVTCDWQFSDWAVAA